MSRLKILKIKMSKRESVIAFIICIVVFLIAIVLIICNLHQTKIFTIKENAYQYYFGEKFNYPANSKLRISDDKETILTMNNQDSYLDSTPIFYTEKDGILLPKTMEYININKNRLQSVSFFSEVLKNGNNLSLYKSSRKINIDGGFLFDGSNIYIFLEPFTAKIGSREIDIEPFSFAEVLYNQSVSIYLKDKDEYLMMDYNYSDFLVKAKSGYSINLNTDVLIRLDGSEELLFSNPDLLKPVI